MQVEKNVRENRERTITRIGTIVRNAEDRFPKLRLLRIFVVLRLFERAIFKGARTLFDTRDETLIAFLFTRRQLFFLFGVVVHLGKPRSEEHTSELQSRFGISYA